MKVAKSLHNPKAGEGEYTHKKLARLINRAGYDCSYSSTKKEGWEKIKSSGTDMIVVAGGDGNQPCLDVSVACNFSEKVVHFIFSNFEEIRTKGFFRINR